MKQFVLQIRYWPLPLIIWTILVLVSFSGNWDRLDRYTMDLAASRAQFVFRVMESVRMWNARHGGVYALVDDNTQPNPYLEVPERDLTSTDGLELTLLNPAYMTRQLADVVHEMSDVRLHLTSLKPLNPGNAPDAWEAGALRAFAGGETELVELVDGADGQVVRYMAPLMVQQECMQCHEHQGYQVGDIRGGLSVSYSAAPLLQGAQNSLQRLIWAHAGIWLFVSALLLFGLSQVRRHLLSLADAKQQLDQLVKQRTAELHILTKAVEYSPVSTVITDRNGRIEYANPRFSEVTGYPVDEVIGRNPRLLQSGETPDSVYEEMWRTITSGEIWQGELLNCKKSGEHYWEQISISPIRDAGGSITHFVALKEDVTDNRARAAKIHYQANYDDLTGLPNRKHFRELLQQQIGAPETGNVFALMFIDLDGFKSINDSFGHDAGDLLLQESARRISHCVRKSDIVARLGGDEFTVILQHASCPDAIAQVAEKIIGELQQPFQLDGHWGQISASIGVAFHPEDADSADELIKRADSAMYEVKAAGRQNYRFCSHLARKP